MHILTALTNVPLFVVFAGLVAACTFGVLTTLFAL